jgi:hypothetical protein
MFAHRRQLATALAASTAPTHNSLFDAPDVAGKGRRQREGLAPSTHEGSCSMIA